jgi:MoaA/NifB/PqqE/SkfB family radical SAM enzyme
MLEDALQIREEAAHEKRNWVRLTFDCNDRCVFCLDANAHDGRMRDRDEVKSQILDGRRKGATRLILSGGEPTIHPHFTDFVRLGRLAGYRKIQTVTNGRLFSYRDFLTRSIDQGLSEITFSLHGPDAKVHDALVGVKGAFDQEVQGLQNALDDGRAVVNIDIVVNRANVKHLAEMLERFYAMGVKEFDLLQIVPFGRAFSNEGRDTLFYDLEEMRPHLLRAFAWSAKPDVHLWLNRFPPPHLEGYEHLIQDPYKLNDEVRGRKEEFARLLDDGIELDCREPARCRRCYLERLCDTLSGFLSALEGRRFRRVRVDTEWESKQEPVFGGDPASERRSRSLPVIGAAPPAARRRPSVDELIREAGAEILWLVAPDLPRALEEASRLPGSLDLELELDSYDGLAEALESGDRLGGRRLRAVVAPTPAQAVALLGIAGAFEVVVALERDTAAWLLSLDAAPGRLAIRQPTHERRTDAAAHDVDLQEFFADFRHEVPVEGVPLCVLGRAPRQPPPTVDLAMLDAEGRPEIFRFTKRFITDHYFTKSVRCRECVHDLRCDGIHVNYVRARGYGLLAPVRAPAA